MVPEHAMRSMKNYIENHVSPGSFLRAVFEHELFEAFGRADIENRYALFSIVSWIYNNAPYDCHGSSEIVKKWLEKRFEKEPKSDEITSNVPVSGDGGEKS